MVISTISNMATPFGLMLVCGNPKDVLRVLSVSTRASGVGIKSIDYLLIAVNILTDLIFFALTIPMLWESSLDTRQKISVMAFVGLSFLYITRSTLFQPCTLLILDSEAWDAPLPDFRL
jgi:hypothetical protein